MSSPPPTFFLNRSRQKIFQGDFIASMRPALSLRRSCFAQLYLSKALSGGELQENALKR